MNKYKIVSIILSVALLTSIARLVLLSSGTEANCSNETSAQTVMKNILSRKSVRSFTDKPVSRTALDTLVKAAMAAPTGMDVRPWRFVIVDDSAVIKQLAERQPKAKMLTEAKAAIVVCADTTVIDKMGKPSRNWMLDCSAATENLLLQAEAMGLGAVWTAGYPYPERMEAIGSVVKLPENIVPFCLVPIGYPKGDPQPKDKYTKDNVHYNAW